MTFNTRVARTFSAMILVTGLAMAPAAFAADAMGKGDGMSADQMHKPDDKMGMAHDGMAKDCAMKPDGMKPDGMKKDGMGDDAMSKDCADMSGKPMTHDAMTPDSGMSKKSN